MWQTLFHIPAEWMGIPMLGWGWLLGAWALISLVLAWRPVEGKSRSQSLLENLPFLLIGGFVIVAVLPRLEESSLIGGQSKNLGLPVHGYGVLLFAAIVAGVSLALRRARRMGLHADIVLALALWLFVAGFLGARFFFVFQYFDQFRSNSWPEFFLRLVNIAEGGLVVYGSLIGALLAYLLFVRKHRLPALATADLLAPSMLLGLAIGRIGCLLNGCCYGGPTDYPWGLRFPAESPPYMDQMPRGLAQGFSLVAKSDHARVAYLDRTSPAGAAGLKRNDHIRSLSDSEPIVDGEGNLNQNVPYQLMAEPGTPLVATTMEGEQIEWPAGFAPARSLPIHPTQIYSALNAFSILALVLAISPFTKRDGTLMAITLSLYPVTRFLLEIVRTDEPQLNALGMTISQSVSVLMLAIAGCVWWIVLRQPPGRSVFLEE